MEILGVLTILLIGVWIAVQVGLLVTAIIKMAKFSSENPKTVDSAKSAALFTPLGFGLLIGYIVYIVGILPKVKHDAELKTQVQKSLNIGTLIFLGMCFAVGVAVSSIVNAIDEHYDSSASNGGVFSKVEVSKWHNEDGVFAAQMPCQDTEREVSDSEVGKLAIVQCKEDSYTEAGMVMYVENDAFEGADESAIVQLLDAMASNLSSSSSFGGATDVKVSSQSSGEFLGNPSREAVFSARFNGENARIYWRAFFARTSSGVKLFQIMGVGGGEDIEKSLENYEMISKDFRIL